MLGESVERFGKLEKAKGDYGRLRKVVKGYEWLENTRESTKG